MKDRGLLLKVAEELDKIAEDPYGGKDKKQDLKGVWGWDFTRSGVHYRIAYVIDKKKHQIAVFMIGPREGFWDEVKELWRMYGKAT